MEECLNIDCHTKRLICKALNKFRSHEEAAKALGINVKTLRECRVKLGIVQRWVVKEKSPLKRPLQSVVEEI